MIIKRELFSEKLEKAGVVAGAGGTLVGTGSLLKDAHKYSKKVKPYNNKFTTDELKNIGLDVVDVGDDKKILEARKLKPLLKKKMLKKAALVGLLATGTGLVYNKLHKKKIKH